MCNQCIKNLADSYQAREVIRKQIGKCPAMKALEALTPSGSEFWEDPEFCFQYVKERLSSLFKRVVQLTGEHNRSPE